MGYSLQITHMNQERNTKKHTTLHLMVFPTGKGKYTAVCFELGLVREGNDALKLRARIASLSRKYVESVVKNKLSDDLLNQKLPARYNKKFKEAVKAIEEYEMKKWQKAFETLIWKMKQSDGKLLPIA